MIEQGKKINSWGKNVYVKVPVINSKNKTFASITAHGPSSRMQENSIEFYIRPLQQAARDIQDSLSESST